MKIEEPNVDLINYYFNLKDKKLKIDIGKIHFNLKDKIKKSISWKT